MSLDPRVANLLRTEFVTVRTVRNRALRHVLAQARERLGLGTGLVQAIDKHCGAEYRRRGVDYLERTLRRLAELREPWTEALRADVQALLQRELASEWDDLVALRDQQLGPQLKEHVTGQLSDAKATALGRIEVELAFRLLQEEKRRLPIAELLAAPRYADVLQHWQQANKFADRSPPADNEAAREAILALEAVARLVADDPNATLGKAIGVLNARTDDAGRLLLSSFEKVWAFSNQARSVRHGGGAGDPITNPEAQYVVGVAGNAIRLLLTFDLG